MRERCRAEGGALTTGVGTRAKCGGNKKNRSRGSAGPGVMSQGA